ncbi:hydrogenase expression/formation protein, partial [bacterium]|nr:hydrogenase expression/formation protein [bacterium]
GIEVGDNIIVTKGIAIEATSIIAREKGAEIREIFSAEFVERCANFIYEPGISVVQDAAIARSVGSIHAMHDPTEGGLASGLHEMAMAGDVHLHINLNQIPVLPESKLLCEQFGLDILGSIASGALLLAVPQAVTSQLLAAYEKQHIPAVVIGTAVEAGAGVTLFRDNQPQELPYFSTDEITRIFT